MNSWTGAHEEFSPHESDAGACDLEGKSIQTYSQIQKKYTGRGVGSFSQQFPCLLSSR